MRCVDDEAEEETTRLREGQKEKRKGGAALPAPSEQPSTEFRRKNVFVMGKRTKTIEKRIAQDDPALIELSRLIPKSASSSSREREMERERTFKDIIDKLIDKGVITDTTDAIAGCRYKLTVIATMLDAEAPCEDFKTGDTDEDLDNAIELFKRLNKGGKTLSRGDAEAANLTHRATAGIVLERLIKVIGAIRVTLEGNLVNPIMRTDGQKNDLLAVGKSEEHSVTSIDTKTPHLLAFRLQLFGVE